MSEFSIAEQTFVFLQACVFGVFMGIIYDFFRSIRIVTRAKAAATAFFDIAFSVILVAGMFLFYVNNTDGIIRLYTFVGAFLGACLYFFSVSSLLVGLNIFILRKTGKLFKNAYNMSANLIKKLIYRLNADKKTKKNKKVKKNTSIFKKSVIYYKNKLFKKRR